MYRNWPSFDELVQIARENPEQLEALRQQKVKEIIDAAPENLKPRLRGIQFQVDCHRRIHKNPLASCISISRMMRESLDELNNVLNGKMPNDRAPASEQPNRANQANNVVQFPVAS